jgi:hypothetical protein
MMIARAENHYYYLELSDDLKTVALKLTDDSSKSLLIDANAVGWTSEIGAQLETIRTSVKSIMSGPGSALDKMTRTLDLNYPDPQHWALSVAPGAPLSLVNFTCDSYQDAGDKAGRVYLCMGNQDSRNQHRGWGLIHIWRRHYPDSSLGEIMELLTNGFLGLATDIAQDETRYVILFKDVASRRHGTGGGERFATYDGLKNVMVLDWQIDRFNVITHYEAPSSHYKEKVARGEWKVCLKIKPG